MIDLNSKSHMSDRVNFFIDKAIDGQQEKPRRYLGASIVGAECERQVQYHLLAANGLIEKKQIPARTKRIFDRGDVYEDKALKWLTDAGFKIDGRQEDISDFFGIFQGHCDGIISECPDGLSLILPCLWECKCLGSKGWNKLEREGLKKYSQTYWTQIHLYMHYLGLKGCLFTAVNADTMELLHIWVDFSEQTAKDARGKIEHVIQTTFMKELVPRISQDKSFFICKMCDFAEECFR